MSGLHIIFQIWTLPALPRKGLPFGKPPAEDLLAYDPEMPLLDTASGAKYPLACLVLQTVCLASASVLGAFLANA